MPAPVRSPTRSPRSTPRLGRRRFAAGVAGVLTVVGTGAVASQGAQSSTAQATPDPKGATARIFALGTRLQHSRLLSYPVDQVWPAAIRYLRVDRAYALVDRDRDAGFILFDFPLPGRPEDAGRGSVELVATEDASGRAAVRLEISTDAGPTHLPHAIAEGLAKKLKEERGQPAPPPTPTPVPDPTPPSPPSEEGPWADPPIHDDP
ncbi:MAG: hypothetical protein AAGF11_50700 [Myxococcota bacterium]